MSTEQSATPPMPEPVAPKWNVTAWRDRNGEAWEKAPGNQWRIYGQRSEGPLPFEVLERDYGPLTPLAVDNVAALLADESRYRQLWAAQVRDRQSEPRDPAKDAAESALWETVLGIVRRVEGERDAARRELATLAEKIATAIEAKRGPGQSARLVAALTRAADIARQHGEVEPPESLPTGGDEIGSPDTWTRAKSSTEEDGRTDD